MPRMLGFKSHLRFSSFFLCEKGCLRSCVVRVMFLSASVWNSHVYNTLAKLLCFFTDARPTRHTMEAVSWAAWARASQRRRYCTHLTTVESLRPTTSCSTNQSFWRRASSMGPWSSLVGGGRKWRKGEGEGGREGGWRGGEDGEGVVYTNIVCL